MNDLHDISALPAYLLAICMAAPVLADIRLDVCRLVSGRNVVLLAIGSWYLLEAIMIPTALRTFSQEQYNIGILHVGLACGSFLLAYHYTLGCVFFPSLAEKMTFFDDRKWLWRLVLVGSLIGFSPIVYYTGTQWVEMLQGMMGQRATWGGMLGRGRYGDARAAFLMLQMFIGGVAPFAAILLLDRGTTLIQRAYCALVVFWPILSGFGSGTRSAMLTAFAVPMAVVFWRLSPTIRKRMVFVSLACVPLVYALMGAIVNSRGSGQFDWEARGDAEYVGNEMFRELLFIVSKVPEVADYQYGYVYYVQMVNPIPRFLWPSKPTLDTGLLMAELYGAVDARGEAFLTISPGLIGEMYLNFGTLGILGLSLFGGWLVKGWDQIPRLFGHSLPAMMYYSGGLGVLFIMGRSFTMPMFYGLLSLAMLAWLIRVFNPHAVADPNPGVAITDPRS